MAVGTSAQFQPTPYHSRGAMSMGWGVASAPHNDFDHIIWLRLKACIFSAGSLPPDPPPVFDGPRGGVCPLQNGAATDSGAMVKP